MAKFKVLTNIIYQKELTVYADDEGAAMEKAEDIARGWQNVHECEAQDAEETSL